METHQAFGKRRILGLLALVLISVKVVNVNGFASVRSDLNETACPENPVFFKRAAEFADMKFSALTMDCMIIIAGSVVFHLAGFYPLFKMSSFKAAQLCYIAVSICIIFQFCLTLETIINTRDIPMIISHFSRPYKCASQTEMNMNVNLFVLFLSTSLVSVIVLVHMYIQVHQLCDYSQRELLESRAPIGILFNRRGRRTSERGARCQVFRQTVNESGLERNTTDMHYIAPPTNDLSEFQDINRLPTYEEALILRHMTEEQETSFTVLNEVAMEQADDKEEGAEAGTIDGPTPGNIN